jgi:CDGSH-type Zn-finger protein
VTDPRVEIVFGGPMLVRGLPLRRVTGRELGPELTPRADYAICRCGGSASMPFCDREPPFACFEEAAPTRALGDPPVWEVPDPALPCVALKASGPARVAGDVEVVGPRGEPVPAHGGRRSLCRCGASACQPLCDGTHKVAPFPDP